MAKALDDRMHILVKQGRAPFVGSSRGHEGIQVASTAALGPDDWLVPHYRGLANSIVRGLTMREWMLAVFAKADDPAVGRPQHPGRLLQLPPAQDRAGLAGGRELGSEGGGHRLRGQAARRGLGDAVHVRRRRDEPGRLPRGRQLRRRAPAAGRLRLREQQLRDLGADPAADGEPRTSPTAPPATASPGVTVDGTDVPACYARLQGGGRARAPRRGADADRRQDLAHELAHLRGQPRQVPRQGGDRRGRGGTTRSRASTPGSSSAAG